MLFYIKCPSCSRIISYEMDKFYNDIDDILNNPSLDKKEKEKLGASLFDKYNIKPICCRIRIMGLIPYHKIINT